MRNRRDEALKSLVDGMGLKPAKKVIADTGVGNLERWNPTVGWFTRIIFYSSWLTLYDGLAIKLFSVKKNAWMIYNIWSRRSNCLFSV